MDKQVLSKLEKNALGYWELAVKPSEHELQEYYAQKYYQDYKGTHQASYSPQELEFIEAKIQQRSAMIDQLLPQNSTKTFLDVGCGEGFQLSYFLQQGWEVKGLDFSSDGMAKQNPSCLPFLEAGNIYDLLAQEVASGRTYQVVWLQHVLEHVIDPQELLRELLKLVSEDGCAVITVPNDFSNLQLTALETEKIKSPFWVQLPDHLSYFDAASLKATTEANGWECRQIMADFPIDWFIMNDAANYVENKQQGKAAHNARVALENLIQQQPMSAVLEFWTALANIGMGRSITAFVSPNAIK